MNCYAASILLVLYTALLSPLGRADDRVEFNRDIRPILSENCFLCHGFDEESREADLRLDTFEGATEFDSIVPGDPAASELIRRIVTNDDGEVMPPTDTEKRISNEELELIKRWIKQGAHYQEHWAWQSLTRPEVPGSSSLGRNAPQGSENAPVGPAAIDAFLREGWTQQNASPVPPASPRDRLRRLSFDLRGLPPSRKDVAEFERDPTDELFFRFRDRWMNQLAYAEHQAVRWLDLVRWADTSGFVSDEPIASGAYRAWIVRAFDSNLPFDQFSIAQLAGDLLPNPTDDQLVASGYNRIVNTNCEAGAIEKEQLYKLKGEHVRAVGTVWLGLTTGCAECHDHKFDPLTAKDYYSLAAFFDDLVEAGVYTPGDRREPLHYVHSDSTDSFRDRELSSEIHSLRRRISLHPTDGIADWETETVSKLKDQKSRTDFVWIPASLPAPRILEGEFEMSSIDDRTARETIASESHFLRHHAAELMTGSVKHGGQKTDENQDAYFVDVWIAPDNRPQMLGFQISHGDYGRLGWRTANYETYYWGTEDSGELEKVQTWSDPKRVRRIGDLPDATGWVRLRVPFAKLIKPVGGQSFTSVGMAWIQTGGHVGWGDSGLEIRTDKATALTLGETAIRKWWERPKNRQVYQRRAEYVSKALLANPDKRDELQQEIVVDAFREHAHPNDLAELRTLESELFELRARAVPVLVSRRSDQPKTTRLIHRGDYQDESGPFVTAAVPEFLGSSWDEKKADRLDLARWMFDQDNPLTARVYVNRLWHQFFGRGISETLEDSGTQGDWPSNVALLDWLACEFRDSQWNRDHMVRLLTSTKAYQLSSKPTPDLQERDPGNRWHARQNRFRLTAEGIRDSSLLAAGLLQSTSKVPIHSFFPYQPNPYWTSSDKVMYGSRHMKWMTSPSQNQYSRSLYTFWKRQNIHPTMLAFDAPTRQECTAKRNVTNTPGQALALLNDPIFVEAARVLATRVCNDMETDRSRLDRMFELTLQRVPAPDEASMLIELLINLRQRYAAAPDDAFALMKIGQASTPPRDKAPELAAWTGIARTILNLHEFVNRP